MAPIVWVLAAATAAEPDDVTLSAMTEHGGERVVDATALSEAYLDLLGELGQVVANKPLAPGETLGAFGFDLSFANTFAFITSENDDGTPTAWQRAVPDEEPGNYLFLPQVSARKGLPLSFEIGGTAQWIGNSRQGTFGGFGRAAIVEGYKPWPDLSMQVGYAGYVGNDELELGVLDWGVVLGGQFAFGTLPGINNAVFHPYIAYSQLTITARPVLDADTAAEVGALPVVGATTGADEEHLPPIRVHQLGGGFQVTNGNVLLRLVGTWAPGGIATGTFGMGFTY